MTAKSRSARRKAAREQQERQTASRWLLPAVGAVIAVVAIVAVVLSQSGSGGSAEASVAPATAGPPTVGGTVLPKLTDPSNDPAIGMLAPTISGTDYDGNAVNLAPTGKPMLVIVGAHWCPHCNRELPLIQQWINEGKAPADVDLRSVSTAITPEAPNYPPSTWLDSIGWTVPVINDSTNAVANALGVSGYPFFVLLDGTGHVVERLSGEIPVDQLEQILAAAPRS